MPMSIVAVISLVASASCYMLTPVLYNAGNGLGLPMWVSFAFCAFAMVCGFVAAGLTVYGENHGLVAVIPLSHSNRNKKRSAD